MKHVLRYLAAPLAMVALIVPAGAASDMARVNVALLDVTSLMPSGVAGHSMMGGMSGGQKMMGSKMMGSKMMGSEMMGVMALRVDRPTVKAGKVMFDVVNWSEKNVHEALLVSVGKQAGDLPYDTKKSRVPEQQVKVLGETEDLQPNASKTFEVTLDPGTYMLICNVAGHYASGMATPFTVEP